MSAFTLIKVAMLANVIAQTPASYTSGVIGHQVHGWWGKIFRFDAVWYASVIEHGYQWPGVGLNGKPGLSNLAFFPLFPGLAAGVHKVTGLTPGVSLWLVALGAALAAAAGIYRYVAQWLGGPAAMLSVVLWACAPHSLVIVMPYTEGLFTAFSAWAMVAMRRQRWWLAGTLTALACLTRPTGVVLLIVLLWAKLRSPKAPWRRFLPWAAALATALGFPIYVAKRVGRWDGYFLVQRQWNSHSQAPWLGLVDAWRQLTHGGVGVDARWIGLSVLVMVATLVGWLALPRLRREVSGQLLWLYSVGIMGVALVAGGYPWARARFLLPAFGVYVVFAFLLANRSRTLQLIVVVLAIAVSVFWAGAVAGGSVSP